MQNKGIRSAIEYCEGAQPLADLCGVSKMTVSLWLRNKTQPSATNLAKIVLATNWAVKPWDINPDKEIRALFANCSCGNLANPKTNQNHKKP